MHDELEAALTGGTGALFNDALIVRASDFLVMMATDMTLEGRLAAALRDGMVTTAGLATTPLYDEPLFSPDGFSVVTSVPLRARGGEVDAFLVGVTRGQRVVSLLRQMQGFWAEERAFQTPPGQAYLAVSPDLILASPEYLFSTDPDVRPGVSHTVFPMGEAATTGSAEYIGLLGEPVVGAYEWFPDESMGLVLEVPRAVVYAGLTDLAPFFIGLVAITTLLVVVFVPLATRRSLRPLGALARVVENLARGQFEERAPVVRSDEIGRLAKSFNSMAGELSAMYSSLEDRVTERTHQIQTASEVARDAALIRDVDSLLDAVVRLISERFGFYHAGVFLVDGNDAVLRAASSEGGRRMLARSHRLAIGKVGIVGYVTGTGKPRIALDVGADAVHIASSDLPHTRSEMALPLRIGDRVLGALDVQSTDPNAFDDHDVVVLQTMADQLATALENARLLASLSRQSTDRQQVIELTSRLAQEASYDAMLSTVAVDVAQTLGYARAVLASLESGEIVVRSASLEGRSDSESLGVVVPPGQGPLGRAIASKQTVVEPDPDPLRPEVTVAVPLHSRGVVVGALALTRRGETELPQDDLDLLQLLATPLAAALENARLAEEAQRSLQEVDTLYRQQTGAAWQQILRTRSESEQHSTYQPGAGPGDEETGLLAPIEVRGQVIGALDILGRAGSDLDHEDEIILEAVTKELAGALEQARLMDEIRKRAVQLQAAAEIARDTTSQLDSGTLLSRAASLLHDRFGYDQVAIYRLDWTTSQATVDAAAGRGAKELLDDHHSVAVGSPTVIGYVTQSGNAYAAVAEGEDPYFQVTPYHPEARSELGLPLMIADQVFGVIVVRHAQPNAFTRDDITVLEVLTDQIAVGVQNARLFESTLRRAQREQAVVEVTGRIRTSQGIDGILRTAVREMRSAMGARRAQIWLNPPADGSNGGGGEP